MKGKREMLMYSSTRGGGDKINAAKAIIKGLDQDVVINSLPDKKGNIKILVGQLQSTIKLEKLAKSLKRQKDIIKKSLRLTVDSFLSQKNLTYIFNK